MAQRRGGPWDGRSLDRSHREPKTPAPIYYQIDVPAPLHGKIWAERGSTVGMVMTTIQKLLAFKVLTQTIPSGIIVLTQPEKMVESMDW